MKKFLSRVLLVFLGLLFISFTANPEYLGQDSMPAPAAEDPAFLLSDSLWADSLMQSMTLDEKIAQLMMLQVYSNKGAAYNKEMEKLISRHKPGGIIFFHGGPLSQAHLTNRLQSKSKTPLMIAIDGEWGLGFRLDSVISYPRQMQLGAIQDNQLIYQMGQDIAKQMKDVGIHMNFAPVADVNNNPANPVINTRAFGEDRNLVSGKVNAYFKGMQDGGLLVTAKHFPGHGDTNVDSHHALPVIHHDRERLDSVELFPFRMAFAEGLSGVMVAHLRVPVLDDRENRATTLSANVCTDLLQNEMGFKGLVVSDALGMKGVSDHFEAGKLEVEALKAGIDILLMPEDVSKAISCIKKAVRRGEISEERIEHSCRKILMAKAWSGLTEKPHVASDGLYEKLNSREYLALQHQLAEQSISLLKNEGGLIPIKNLESLSLATLNFGIGEESEFTRNLDLYHSADHYFIKDPSQFIPDSSLNRILDAHNTVIISTYYTRSFGKNFGIPEGVAEYINKIDYNGRIIFNFFGYPYALDVMGELENTDAIIVSYTNGELNQRYAAQGIFGGIAIKGLLPVSVGDKFAFRSGEQTEKIRLKYSVPEAVSMNYDSLLLMNDVIKKALRQKAVPGCQLLVARKGEVIWHESYGYHTYRNEKKVKIDDIYDLASITKVSSTIPSLMKLTDEGLFCVDSTLAYYLPELDTSNKADLVIKDILTHQSGLAAWIPFYKSTLQPLDTSQSLFSTKFSHTYPYKMGPGAYANRNIIYVDSLYKKDFSIEYPLKVAEDMYLRADYRDTIYKKIAQSELGEKVYKYSDLGYYYMYKIVENLTGTLFYTYNWINFYAPLGAESMGFLPLNRFSEDRIVPTENDVIFRKQLLKGNVHDPGAAMLGGICGHAGLFSNANDLAKLMQMYLNNGRYGGERYIDSTTLARFSSCQFCENDNRRGLGFDRPMEEAGEGPVCDEASSKSYGHTGFTGTIAWVDPEYDLLYVFLANRIHPNQDNLKLISLNVRTDIQHFIYSAIEE